MAESADELFGKLLHIMTQLRGENGCPWDRQQTHQSIKPYFVEETYEVLEAIDEGDALNRIDFGGLNVLAEQSMDALAGRLDAVSGQVDVVILNQQVPAGTSPPAMIQRLNGIIQRHPSVLFIVDSRDRAELYRGAVLKLNTHEAARLIGEPRPLAEKIDVEAARHLAARLWQRMGRPVFPPTARRGLLALESVPRLCRAPGTSETASSRRGDQLRTGRCSRTLQGTTLIAIPSARVHEQPPYPDPIPTYLFVDRGQRTWLGLTSS